MSSEILHGRSSPFLMEMEKKWKGRGEVKGRLGGQEGGETVSLYKINGKILIKSNKIMTQNKIKQNKKQMEGQTSHSNQQELCASVHMRPYLCTPDCECFV